MGTELQPGILYVRSEDGSWNRLCAITDIKEICTPSESCSMLDRAKKVIKEHIESAMCGIFDTRNCVGDDMVTIYDEDGLTVDICYHWEYFEVFGLSMAEFQLLEDFYETLRKEVRAKEKETTEMNDYIVIAEHGFGDSVFDKIYNNLDISREMRFAYTGKWPGIECKTTAKDQYRNRGKLPEISEVIFNKPATIVKWADGTKTVVKVQGREKYDKEKGLAMAIAKKAMGNSSYYATIMNRYLEDKK